MPFHSTSSNIWSTFSSSSMFPSSISLSCWITWFPFTIFNHTWPTDSNSFNLVSSCISIHCTSIHSWSSAELLVYSVDALSASLACVRHVWNFILMWCASASNPTQDWLISWVWIISGFVDKLVALWCCEAKCLAAFGIVGDVEDGLVCVQERYSHLNWIVTAFVAHGLNFNHSERKFCVLHNINSLPILKIIHKQFSWPCLFLLKKHNIISMIFVLVLMV